MPVLLSAAYFPPVEYFAVMAKEFTLSPDRVNPSIVYIEACENYQKQSYRNRCTFYSGSGPQSLSFPVVHSELHNIPVTEIEIDYSKPWVQQHKRAIVSAYGTSAYFGYYQDDLFAILDSGIRTLFDLDMAILRFFLEKTGVSAEIRFTDHFLIPEYRRDWTCHEWDCFPDTGQYGKDFREAIHPKRKNCILEMLGLAKPYFQVFSQKYGFASGLSVMDLLFNEGPDSIMYLKNLD